MNADEKRSRKEIIKLEKQMQRNPSASIVMSLAEKYVEVGEPHQAVAILMEGWNHFRNMKHSRSCVLVSSSRTRLMMSRKLKN